MANAHVTIDIVSDIVCPWCWLGKAYLDQAIDKHSDIDVQIKWHPFMLDPETPKDGVPYKEYMRKKFGGGTSDRFKSMRDHLEAASNAAGINFRFDGIPMRPNTLKAHCLVKWAGGQGKAHSVSEHLFRAFFDEHLDVGDSKVLANIADKAGMDGDLVTELLASERDFDTLQSELDYFRNLGISGVPFFIYNGQFSVQGGQPAEVHEQALVKAKTIPARDVMTLLTN